MEIHFSLLGYILEALDAAHRAVRLEDLHRTTGATRFLEEAHIHTRHTHYIMMCVAEGFAAGGYEGYIC